MEILNEIVYWHWLVLGIAMLILEMFAPGAILMWFGVAGLLVGVLQFVFGDVFGPQLQWLVFSAVSVISIIVWKRYAKKHKLDEVDENSTLNQRGKGFIGKEFFLSQAIVNGVGKAKVGDTHWRVTGPELPQDAKVKVVGFEGATLLVESVA